MIEKGINTIKSFFNDVSVECLVVCVYLMCLPFTIVETPLGSLLKVVSMPIIAILSYKLFFGKCKDISFNMVHLTYSLYMFYTIGGLLLLSDPSTIVLTKDMALAYATVILITMRVYNPNEKRLIEASWLILGLICIYLGIFCTSQRIEGQNRQFVVIGKNYEDPNQFCAYFLLPIIICVKGIIKKTKLRPLYGAMIVLMLYAILKGGSRGGIIAIAVAIGSYIFWGIKGFGKKIGIVLISALCIAIVVTVVVPMLPEDVQERYSIQSVVEDRGSGRFDIWEYLIQHTIEKPERIIRGSGILSTAETLRNSTVNDVAKGAHNQFIQVFADQGIVGILLFMIWSATCFFRSIKRYPEYACAFLGLMALAFSLSFYSFKPLTNIVIMCAITVSENKIQKTSYCRRSKDEVFKRYQEKSNRIG